jgi:flagellar hook-associated protein 3 FlgL
MYARATSFAVTSRAIHFGALHGSNILRLQQQISSGIRIDQPSDGPLAYQQISGLENRLAGLRASETVINDANTRLNTSVSELTEANRLVTSASRLAQRGIQALGPGERAALATEAEGLLFRWKGIANSRVGNQYLFGGTRSGQPPYVFGSPAAAGRLASSQYQGGARHAQSLVSPTLAVDSLYAGDQVFDSPDRQATVIVSQTGISLPASGTDSMTGRATLTVRHTATNYAPGSGIQPAAASAASDTVLGPAGVHSVVINDTSGTGASGTVSLNGAEPVAWDSSMTSLQLTGPAGQRVHVNMSSITPGFSGNVAITTAGTLSLDGGKSEVPITWNTSIALTDPVSGGRVRLNTLTLRQSGTDELEFPGTTDVFETLDALVRDLRGERKVPAEQLNASLGRTLERLEQLGDQVLEITGIQSSTLAGLEQVGFRNEDLQLELQTEQSNLQSTDIAQAVIHLQQEQLLQQYTYTITSRIMSQSLLNYLS